MKSLKNNITILLVLVVGLVSCPFCVSIEVVNAATDGTEEVEELQGAASELEKKEKDTLKKLQSAQGELNAVNGAFYSTQSAINKTEAELKKIEENIDEKSKDVKKLEEKKIVQREVLKKLVQDMYKSYNQPLIFMVFEKNDFLDALVSFDQMEMIKKRVLVVIDDIDKTKEEIENEKNELKEVKDEHENLLVVKEDQKQDLLANKVDLQQEVSEKEADLAKIRAKLAKVKSELSKMLGKNYEVNDIEDAVEFASSRTGVRKDFLMGMLVVESDLGRYTGGCNYKESRMSEYRVGIFKEICDDLGYGYKEMKLSCPPKSYTGTGGAMGVEQFMSDTWMGYKNKIAAITGNNPPDPWGLLDGVTAMALKLSNDGAGSRGGECLAAKRYLGGSHQWYCDRVIYWANNYEKLLQ